MTQWTKQDKEEADFLQPPPPQQQQPRGKGLDTWAAPPAPRQQQQDGWPSAEPDEKLGLIDNWPRDLVPEFEPGKPWKGSVLKSVEDDPTMTPGSVSARVRALYSLGLGYIVIG